FDLADIPPAPRGLPQIEVTFDIDANGILHVGAKDKATGKEQSIVIKASSGLSEGEIDKMVRDAEAHAAEDKKFEQLVAARNKGDGLVHAVRKTMKDAADKVQADEKERIEAAIKELEEVMKTDDVDAIEAKAEKLTDASASLAQRLYAEQAKQAGPEAGPQQAGGSAEGPKRDDIVDAEFEEVRDNDRK
ncbi:MAG: Hsp70 family protein, partial [Planctomycetota bacterium]